MDFMRKMWPVPFTIKKGDVESFVMKLVVFALICAVFGVLMGVLCGVPYVGIVLAILCGFVELYGLAGITLCILQFTGVLKY